MKSEAKSGERFRQDVLLQLVAYGQTAMGVGQKAKPAL